MNYQKMFEKEGYTVAWSFHTAMDLDEAVAYHITKLQKSPESRKFQLGWDAASTIAFFYDQKKILSNTLSNCSSICIQDIKPLIHPLNIDSQTFHAKVSFICLKKTEENESYAYRIAVYSCNLTRSNSVLDIGGVFDLEFLNESDNKEENEIEKAEENGRQFAAFLDKLNEGLNKSGDNWLKTKGLVDDKSNNLYKQLADGFFLKDTASELSAEIFFGGCGGKQLYEHIGIENMDKDNSIVLTPPIFIAATQQAKSMCNNDDFKNFPLYDLKSSEEQEAVFSSSHAKAYLIQKSNENNEPQYSFLFGSANATPRGIGWNIISGKESENGTPSVECLICYWLEKEDFDRLYEGIQGKYKRCTYNVDELQNLDTNSLNHDPIGEFLSKQKVDSVSYDSDKKILCYTIVIVADKDKIRDLDEKSPCYQKFPFYPLEYAEGQYTSLKEYPCEENANGDIITIKLCYHIPGDEPKPAQGELIVGTSKRILPVPQELYDGAGLETVKSEEIFYDIFLTRAMDEENPKKYLDGKIVQLKGMADHLSEGNDKKDKIRKIVEDLGILQQIFEEEGTAKDE